MLNFVNLRAIQCQNKIDYFYFIVSGKNVKAYFNIQLLDRHQLFLLP